MSRLYEVMFIVRPDVDDEEVEKLITGFTSTVTAGGGSVIGDTIANLSLYPASSYSSCLFVATDFGNIYFI